ncbi:MAG: ABC transporter ATP-binding protein [Sulfolobales archaeon]
MVSLDRVRMYFVLGPLGRRKIIRAVDGVSIEFKEGEIHGVVGESGSGKSTLGRVAIRIYRPTSGRVFFMGRDITNEPERRLRGLRRFMQLIPQDPYSSFNTFYTVGESIKEALLTHENISDEEARERVLEMLERVGLMPSSVFYERRPTQLSGGQLQRAAIARAMILNPKFIVADEPTSNLDLSIRASILELLLSFKEKLNQSIMFITHDIVLAGLISNRISVMYLGQVVEQAETKRILEDPQHPYTIALISSIPLMRTFTRIREIELRGEIPDPSNPPKGCRLWPRCPLAMDICREKEPPEIEISKGHIVRCWLHAEK